MTQQMSRRSVLGASVAAMGFGAALTGAAVADDKARKKLDDEGLGLLLKAMGLETSLAEKRYDFAFKSNVNDQEWELSMSAVLSQDANSVWIMAWLDNLPKSASDVPRTALLRLLSDNDKLGKGKFFAYIASNRRFVLQRVVPNEGMTSASLRADLDDLGATVVATYPHWSTENWKSASQEDPAQAAKSGVDVKGSAPQGPASRATQSAANDSKFNAPAKK
jgi:hypothetical protein